MANPQNNSFETWTSPGTPGSTSGVCTNWTVYNSSNSGLQSNYITTIQIDLQGMKWIGTYGGGVSKFDNENWETYTTSNSGLPGDIIMTIKIDSENIKWIGGNVGGLAKFDDENWTVFNSSNSGMPADYISSIEIDSKNNKWIASSGLVKYDDSTWTVYNYLNSNLPYGYGFTLIIDEYDSLWIGTNNDGVVVFNENEFATEITENKKLQFPTILIYPNPITDLISIEAKQNIEQVLIYNLNGILVYCDNYSPNNSTKNIDLSFLAKGTYIIRIRTINQIVDKKILKI